MVRVRNIYRAGTAWTECHWKKAKKERLFIYFILISLKRSNHAVPLFMQSAVSIVMGFAANNLDPQKKDMECCSIYADSRLSSWYPILIGMHTARACPRPISSLRSEELLSIPPLFLIVKLPQSGRYSSKRFWFCVIMKKQTMSYTEGWGKKRRLGEVLTLAVSSSWLLQL